MSETAQQQHFRRTFNSFSERSQICWPVSHGLCKSARQFDQRVGFLSLRRIEKVSFLRAHPEMAARRIVDPNLDLVPRLYIISSGGLESNHIKVPNRLTDPDGSVGQASGATDFEAHAAGLARKMVEQVAAASLGYAERLLMNRDPVYLRAGFPRLAQYLGCRMAAMVISAVGNDDDCFARVAAGPHHR
jgi:hypothetical protein